MPFTFSHTSLPGVTIVEPRVFTDHRGFFIRWDDPLLAIPWPVSGPFLSRRDRRGAPLQARRT